MPRLWYFRRLEGSWFCPLYPDGKATPRTPQKHSRNHCQCESQNVALRKKESLDPTFQWQFSWEYPWFRFFRATDPTTTTRPQRLPGRHMIGKYNSCQIFLINSTIMEKQIDLRHAEPTHSFLRTEEKRDLERMCWFHHRVQSLLAAYELRA